MYKILYIDDNKSLTKLFSMLAADYSFTGFVSNTEEHGFDLALRETPDVILIDIHMENRNGFDFTARIKTDTRLSSIPIIGCSVTYENIGEKMALLGALKFINEKPATIEKLNKILEGVLPPIN